MSWQTMASELEGQTPIPMPFALILINRAWVNLQRDFMWSFLFGDASVPTPAPISAGTVTVTLGSNLVVSDSVAAAAWAENPLVTPLATQQFRIGTGTAYNIIGYAINTPSAGLSTLTLDRLYVDTATQSGSGYQIFQCYFNGPTKDFMWWESIRDPISGYTLAVTMTRTEVDDIDPQRFQGGWPEAVIPYTVNRQAGQFSGYPMYEMWPAPLNNITYVGTYYRSGMPFVNPTDTVNAPLQEDIVIELAKTYAYEWAIANPDKVPRGDFKFLYTASHRRYQDMLNGYMLMDEGYSHRHRIPYGESLQRLALPWVSMREGIMYTAD